MATTQLTPAKAPWLASEGFSDLSAALGGIDFRVVGGAVRDALGGRGDRVDDLDLAVACGLDEARYACEGAGLRTECHPFMPEVLFVDLPGRSGEPCHAGMRCIGGEPDGFARDARRRDFTVNALCCAASGAVEDHVGGLADAAARRVRFVSPGAATEDPVRLLRYFRMRAKVGEGPPDPRTLSVVAGAAGALRSANGVRLAREATLLCDTLGVDDFLAAVGLMASTGVLAALAPRADLARIGRFVRETEGRLPDAWGRMAVLGLSGDPHVAWGDWRDYRIALMAEALGRAGDDMSPATVRKAYREAVVDGGRRESAAAGAP